MSGWTETPDEMYSRVQRMVLDEGLTWDLSPNDRKALLFILGLVNVLADEMAKCLGQTVPKVLRDSARNVEAGDKP